MSRVYSGLYLRNSAKFIVGRSSVMSRSDLTDLFLRARIMSSSAKNLYTRSSLSYALINRAWIT
jgi:hypothetical protein